ncbi:YaiI/YqxD family protein [Pseudoalteromonas sp. S16_S37]|uniref:YaiI/YqxD family protein n=1 Tax=Pseudoalteromonas sp. S16_S37 TaxID=2720228 RepID=UPI00168028A5|nr:YaiI/YqxD family protein [Pseudoalteromonas sp. S16_S37]MBD1581948.1 YaiI/YqxD family protein [Pseudoalteromonas sp. S16_S37]
MKIWVDADACPAVIKEIIFRAAQRTQTVTTLVANHAMRVPATQYVNLLQVSKGFDIADNEIVKRVQSGDIVITADIPLAAEVIELGALAINPRGEEYTIHNIKSILNMRDFMDTMRSSGVEMSGGPPKLSNADKQAFGNALDRLLTKARS